MYAFRGTPVRVKDFFASIILPCAAALAMVLASRVVFNFCAGIPGWSALLISLFAGGLIYPAAYFVLPGGRAVLHDIKTSVQLVFKPIRA
jgi:hypothetical protein